MKTNRPLITAAVAALALIAGAAHAQLGMDFTSGGSNQSAAPNQTLGWEFTLSQAQTVTHLGVFDLGDNGLVERHTVGLWSLAGASLGQVTIGAGTASPGTASLSGLGSWRFEALSSSINLAAGTYIIGADYATGADQVRTFFANSSTLVTDPSLTFVQGRFVSNANVTPGFDFPDATFATGGGHFGPNLQFQQGPANLTPEMPAGVQVIPVLLAVGGMALYKRRKASQR